MLHHMNTNSQDEDTNAQSWGIIFLTAGTAWVFFNILLNYGYILSLIFGALNINNDYAVGVIVLVLSVLVTAVGFLIALLVSSTVFGKNISTHAHSGTAIKTGIVFGILQTIVSVMLFTAQGNTFSSELLTATQLIGSIIFGFVSWPLFSWVSRTYGKNIGLRAQLVWINFLSILIAVPLSYVTISLAYESYSIHPNMIAVTLWYGYYAIIAFVALSIFISQIRKSIRWSVVGLIIPMLPLTLFYLVGVFQF